MAFPAFAAPTLDILRCASGTLDIQRCASGEFNLVTAF